MDFKKISLSIEERLSELFEELRSGIAEREDSRAFGAMIEKRITAHWHEMCAELGYEFVDIPGRRTIFDFACKIEGRLFGFDVKTKDLDTSRYSDGGVCAIGNLLKYMANDNGVFVIVEFGHNKSTTDKDARDIEYIRVAPFHALPQNCYRIENLGTGQVRLNYTINQVWDEIEWGRSYSDFFDLFCALALTHYRRVKMDAEKEFNQSLNFKNYDMLISDSSDRGDSRELIIGAIFTQLQWADFAIEKFGLFDKWRRGATVFDPTMGEGNLLEALVRFGLQKGCSLQELPVGNLYGTELNKRFFEAFFKKMKSTYGIDLPRNNFLNGDIFFQKDERRFDIIFGNPPWQNFVDLPHYYKSKIKSEFFRYDLIGNSQDLLLGGSRIDIAALVIQKTIEKNLKNKGEAIYFMPLSLLLNDGANQYFRRYEVNGIKYCIDKVFDFNDLDVFGGIATRYGLIRAVRDKKQSFPIAYERWEKGAWVHLWAQPIFHGRDPLSIGNGAHAFQNFEPISVEKYSTPRQGINTCGANDIFFFDAVTEKDDGLYIVSNQSVQTILPKEYVYPLITRENFMENDPIPQKWVLLPYSKKGRPLEYEETAKYRDLKEYLEQHKDFLAARKGVLINAWIKKGYWWALLGVGGYSFYPYKVIWEAYGRTTFRPRIFLGHWQANQSLQAFMAAKSNNEAEDIHKRLQDSRVQDYLLSLKMEGTMNWAQPGKIKKLIRFHGETASLFATDRMLSFS